MTFSHCIDGFQSRDETAILVHKTIANYASRFALQDSNSQKTFFCTVLCTNMAAVTSGENHQYELLLDTKYTKTVDSVEGAR